MQPINRRVLILAFYLFTSQAAIAYASSTFSGRLGNRRLSPENITYYIDPVLGNDHNNGMNLKKPWRTFVNIDRLVLAPGDVVDILSPGTFHRSLVLAGQGTGDNTIKVKFAPGRYDFFPDSAVKKQLHITNNNDAPYEPKAIALYFNSCKFIDLQGKGAKIELRGKMIETFIDESDHIHMEGLSFDYYRPTVSECTVSDTSAHYADLSINPDSKFSVKDSVLTWVGEGWSYQPGYYWQVFDPATGNLLRINIPAKDNKYVRLGDWKVRVYFEKNPGFKMGLVYQNRDIIRDGAGIFLRKSKNIWLQNIRLYFAHGMGIVSQYCENIKMTHVSVKTAASSGRTCAAWADILHFAGCKGLIDIESSYLSAANDDAINIHGIHLKIVEKLSTNSVKVRFMHDQTYGFDAFAPGDSVEFINPQTLLSYANNRIKSVLKLNDKEMMLTLDHPVSTELNVNDALENSTATPRVLIKNDTITSIPTRGILVTTRRRVLIENNYIEHTFMSGIFVSDDASKWYESGMVKDVTIRNNFFYKCGEPVIELRPENTIAGPTAVHSNISIINNHFDLLGSKLFAAKSTSKIKIIGNTVDMIHPATNITGLIKLNNCNDIQITGNKITSNQH